MPWVVMQGFVFLPMTSGAVTDLDYGFVLNALGIALFAWVAFSLVRNVVRLWKVPQQQLTRLAIICVLFVALFFGLMSEGPLVEGSQIESKVLGICAATLCLSLLVVAVRHAIRLRATAPPAQEPETSESPSLRR